MLCRANAGQIPEARQALVTGYAEHRASLQDEKKYRRFWIDMGMLVEGSDVVMVPPGPTAPAPPTPASPGAAAPSADQLPPQLPQQPLLP